MFLAQKEAMEGNGIWELEPAILACDTGAVRARRMLQNLIQEKRKEAAR